MANGFCWFGFGCSSNYICISYWTIFYHKKLNWRDSNPSYLTRCLVVCSLVEYLFWVSVCRWNGQLSVVAKYRSASRAAIQPVPAAVTACRYSLSCTSPEAKTPGRFVFVDFPSVMRYPASSMSS